MGSRWRSRPNGDALAAYAAAVGQTLYVNVTGATGGAVSGATPTFGISSDRRHGGRPGRGC